PGRRPRRQGLAPRSWCPGRRRARLSRRGHAVGGDPPADGVLTVPARPLDRTVLREIHRFWFGDLRSPTDIDKDRTAVWYKQSDATDREIGGRFGPFIPEAAATAWDVAALSREEAVALVVLLDQFPRNLFRQSGEAFAYDAKARAIARALIATGLDRFFFVE